MRNQKFTFELFNFNKEETSFLIINAKDYRTAEEEMLDIIHSSFLGDDDLHIEFIDRETIYE